MPHTEDTEDTESERTLAGENTERKERTRRGRLTATECTEGDCGEGRGEMFFSASHRGHGGHRGGHLTVTERAQRSPAAKGGEEKGKEERRG